MFVSSTFTDLKEERQAAVEAILKAGHIPAGMELFTAGDQSQMAVIKEWIDESDVYLLLLGARYGSIEATTGKSYTHLEYEYALEKGKALFAVVMTEERKEEKIRREGSKVIEQDNVQKYRDFKAIVESNLVEYWNDFKDIKYAVQSTLLNFDKRSELVGWVPGSEATNSGFIAEELARLIKENAELRKQIEQGAGGSASYNGLDLRDVNNMLVNNYYDMDIINKEYRADFLECYNHLPSMGSDLNLLYFIMIWGITNQKKYITVKSQKTPNKLMNVMIEIGLVEIANIELENNHITKIRYYITDIGKRFVLKRKANIDRRQLDYIESLMQQSIAGTKPDEFEIFNN